MRGTQGLSQVGGLGSPIVVCKAVVAKVPADTDDDGALLAKPGVPGTEVTVGIVVSNVIEAPVVAK